ncbi:ThiF family adenylyltransferase [Pontibacillus marinus]|uniref:Thiamine biosynthesis protein ThiF n=1 Tax=Pontibacillus marinus BH030004 = DSM 16465 TaxID=1385511 RepID=A0A0A5FZ20_9BACI|nr:ThiF family adenylyltransferase [Pontibacillus marinus]KGX85024.1 thiamine biosynthesis protein ThiF [Pontibacillus marinus BH030004 = DSM 16465]
MDDRYSRQRLFAPIGEQGQDALSKSSVLIVGAGALGTMLANQMVRAGVGRVRIVDRDYIEISNLQRQILYTEEDVEKALPKAVAAQKHLEKINSDVYVEGVVSDLHRDNVISLIDGMDIVLDGTDNFATRFLLNDACFQKGIPFVYGGAVRSRGMMALFIPEETPCLRCVVSPGAGKGETCDTVGIISPVINMVTSYQATETLKYLTGNKDALHGMLKTFDIWNNQHYDVKLKDPKQDCPTCQENLYPFLHDEQSEEFVVMCGRDSIQVNTKEKMDLAKWEDKLSGVATTKLTPFLLKAKLDDDHTFVLFPDGRVLIQGTEDTTKAKSLFYRFIGL